MRKRCNVFALCSSTETSGDNSLIGSKEGMKYACKKIWWFFFDHCGLVIAQD